MAEKKDIELKLPKFVLYDSEELTIVAGAPSIEAIQETIAGMKLQSTLSRVVDTLKPFTDAGLTIHDVMAFLQQQKVDEAADAD